MTLSESLLSYGDCADFFEKIADDPKGGRIEIGTFDEAQYFRLRCTQYRKLHRRENAKIHEVGMPLHSASEYDVFRLRLKEDTAGVWWVYAERMALQPDQVELLSEMEAAEDGNQT